MWKVNKSIHEIGLPGIKGLLKNKLEFLNSNLDTIVLIFFHKVFREDAEKNSLISLSANWWIMLYLPIKNCMLFMRKP